MARAKPKKKKKRVKRVVKEICKPRGKGMAAGFEVFQYFAW